MDKLDIIFEEFKDEVKTYSQNSSNRNNLYDYESGFRDLTQKYEQELFQSSIGEVPKSKNKKKL